VTRWTFSQSHSGRRNGKSRVSGCSPNFWGTGAVLTHNIKIWSWSPQQGGQGPRNIIQNGQHQCFWCTTAKLLLSCMSAAAYGCTLFLLVTFALHELTVSLATEHQNAPELVRKHIPPPGARHQRHLVVYTQNSSGINCTPMSGHFCSPNFKLLATSLTTLSVRYKNCYDNASPRTATVIILLKQEKQVSH